MKYKNLCLVLFGLVVLIKAVSCASAPPAEEPSPPAPAETAPPSEVPPPGPPVPDQAALDALNAAAARAEEAKRRAEDFEVDFLFPSDWESADSLFDQAEQQRNASTRQDAQDSAARYVRAAEAFDDLFERSLALNYEYAERELTAARNAAAAAGAEALIPDFLLDADNTVARALEEYQAKDYYAAKDSAFDAYAMYTALKAGLDAYRLREEIVERGFEAYDSRNIELADDALYMAADDYIAKNYDSALDRAGDASRRYDEALKTAWQAFASEIRTAASAERQRALDARANVAARQEFDPAEAIFARANTALQRQGHEEAARFYEECLPMFAASAQLALDRRRAAEDALRRAEQRMAESDETARSAEMILQGGR